MTPNAQLIVLSLLAVAVVAIAIWLGLKLRTTPAKREQKRRLLLHQQGRLGDAIVTDADSSLLYYSYSVQGVHYTASQEIEALRDSLPQDLGRVVGSARVKYFPQEPRQLNHRVRRVERDQDPMNTNDYVARLGRMDSCAVSDAMDRLGLQGAVSSIHRMSTEQRIVGKLLTVKLDLAQGRPPSKRHLCTEAIELAQPGDIIAIEQRTGLDAACWGGNLTIGAKVKGVAGVIVDGPVRDVDDSRRDDFPVFATQHTCKTARGRIVETATNEPINICGIYVAAGDYAIADASGVVFIRAADIERVLEAAEAIWDREDLMAKDLRSGKRISEVMGTNYETMLQRKA